jgi:hypothetical protein
MRKWDRGQVANSVIRFAHKVADIDVHIMCNVLIS